MQHPPALRGPEACGTSALGPRERTPFLCSVGEPAVSCLAPCLSAGLAFSLASGFRPSLCPSYLEVCPQTGCRAAWSPLPPSFPQVILLREGRTHLWTAQEGRQKPSPGAFLLTQTFGSERPGVPAARGNSPLHSFWGLIRTQMAAVHREPPTSVLTVATCKVPVI